MFSGRSAGADDDVEKLALVAATDPDDAAAAAALGRLYDRHADLVYRICYSKLHDKPAAEDAAGDTWVRVAKHIRGYRPAGGGFVAWVSTIARNCAIEAGRQKRRAVTRELLTADMLDVGEALLGESPEDTAVRRAKVDELVATLQRLLSTREWEVVVLRFFHGLSTVEIANLLQVTEGSVRVAQTRGIAKLRQWLPRPRVPASPVQALSDAC